VPRLLWCNTHAEGTNGALGVSFLYRCCVHGYSPGGGARSGDDAWSGCILADEMGLGKTLQSLSLAYQLRVMITIIGTLGWLRFTYVLRYRE
jgi:hypothetical protein